MSKTGLLLSMFIALVLPVSWIVGTVAAARSSGVRIPVRIEQDEPLRSVKVFIRDR
jgi:hypothetical protein